MWQKKKKINRLVIYNFSYFLFVWDGRVRIFIQIKDYIYYNKAHCLNDIIKRCCLMNTLALTLNN